MTFPKAIVFLFLIALQSESLLFAQEDFPNTKKIQSDKVALTEIKSKDSSATLFQEYLSRCNSRYGIRCPRQTLTIPSITTINFSDKAMGEFYFPFRGKLLSPYGPRHRRMHAGLDIKLQKGDTVRSAFNGVVRLSQTFHGYGLMVVVSHPNGLETLYAHLSKILVEDGQPVSSGEPIGLGGRTGRATTTHLHFETRVLGEHFNPLKFIDFDTYSLKAEKLIVYNRDGSIQVLAEGQPLEEPLLAEEETSTIDTSVVGDTTLQQVVAQTKDQPSKKVKKSKYHKVKRGDTLYSIARKNNIPLDDLYKKNHLKPGSVLSIGKRLKL
ncbi:peptidoglycan DD-metalloendopeptidase family protein [Williamwhitmania taraxaci]|uniref:LysM domain-containing protein n=1 Tax=Williamwhitmania taraxaci TaxID=1640674 RepID=A0A1G6N3N9_9BACT|nr:M23 family metallopeptidase [Williamwhitmania taraxaci]SDC62064.1 LysM domain-containing protein [Williamwhitmania taraxaci]